MTPHPTDLQFFCEVRSAMQRVAARYGLPLGAVTHLAMPASGMANRLGECTHTGDIRLVLRCTVDGQWCDEPLNPTEVWDTAAHELAHLQHWSHGDAHEEFTAELGRALQNLDTDHREKIVAKLVKMQAARDGEAALGNSDAADAFATAINRMMLEYELHPSDLDYARGVDTDPVIEICVDLTTHKMAATSRIAWQESLARTVAGAHLCTFLVHRRSNKITFVGTRAHAQVAEFAYSTLVVAARRMSDKERDAWARDHSKEETLGFRSGWLAAFITRINERLQEARKASVAAAPAGQQSTALLRLDGALAKAQRYTTDKFTGHASPLQGGYGRRHSEGRARGQAAADRVALGQKAVGTTTRRLIGDR